jgi:hypothetical protein
MSDVPPQNTTLSQALSEGDPFDASPNEVQPRGNAPTCTTLTADELRELATAFIAEHRAVAPTKLRLSIAWRFRENKFFEASATVRERADFLMDGGLPYLKLDSCRQSITPFPNPDVEYLYVKMCTRSDHHAVVRHHEDTMVAPGPVMIAPAASAQPLAEARPFAEVTAILMQQAQNQEAFMKSQAQILAKSVRKMSDVNGGDGLKIPEQVTLTLRCGYPCIYFAMRDRLEKEAGGTRSDSIRTTLFDMWMEDWQTCALSYGAVFNKPYLRSRWSHDTHGLCTMIHGPTPTTKEGWSHSFTMAFKLVECILTAAGNRVGAIKVHAALLKAYVATSIDIEAIITEMEAEVRVEDDAPVRMTADRETDLQQQLQRANATAAQLRQQITDASQQGQLTAFRGTFRGGRGRKM